MLKGPHGLAFLLTVGIIASRAARLSGSAQAARILRAMRPIAFFAKPSVNGLARRLI